MKSGWFQKKIEQLSKLKGYQKPDKYPNALKLDSNENYAIEREFSLDLIKQIEDDLDVREFFFDQGQKLESIDLGHFDVEQNNRDVFVGF